MADHSFRGKTTAHLNFVGLLGTAFVAVLSCTLSGILTGCMSATFVAPNSQSASISITPSTTRLQSGGSLQFAATVSNVANHAIVWTLYPATSDTHSGSASAVGTISASGLYTAPANIDARRDIEVVATSSADANAKAVAIVTVSPTPTIEISPATASVKVHATQSFTAALSDASLAPVKWRVDGIPGGSVSKGTISADGTYTAPAVDPGTPLTIQAVGSASNIVGTAVVMVVNAPGETLQGIAYDKLLRSWNHSQLSWIRDLSGLQWDSTDRAWKPVPGWSQPLTQFGPRVFYIYTALDPITEMAIAKRDTPLMEELALFHLALLEQRSTTVGAMLKSAAASGAHIGIDGAASDRTFESDTLFTATQPEVTECQLCNSRYLLSAARLLHAIAQSPPAMRSHVLGSFVSSYSHFLANEQLIRMLYGTTPWSHWANPDIPQPLVSGWNFLSSTGYVPPRPIRYQAAMTDAELWILADAAEILGADAAAPDLGILDADTRSKLKDAVAAGSALLASRSHHLTAPDGADTLFTLAGDYDDHPDLAYSAYDGETVPSTPSSRDGLMSDAEHSSILAPVFQSLYENRLYTGASFPTLSDVVSLANTYVHLAFNGDHAFPDFNNYIDGWNGWFRVGEPDIPGGYPPHQYCDALSVPINCMTPGAVQGWGHLAIYNPDLAALEQDIIDLANNQSDAAIEFKARHYYYNGPYSSAGAYYPDMMIYIGGDMSTLVR